MLTCSDVSELSFDIMESSLSLKNRWAIFMHLRKCPHCKLYLKQLKLTAEVIKNLPFGKQPVDSAAILERINLPID
jgi:hypothetical protein